MVETTLLTHDSQCCEVGNNVTIVATVKVDFGTMVVFGILKLVEEGGEGVRGCGIDLFVGETAFDVVTSKIQVFLVGSMNYLGL